MNLYELHSDPDKLELQEFRQIGGPTYILMTDEIAALRTSGECQLDVLRDNIEALSNSPKMIEHIGDLLLGTVKQTGVKYDEPSAMIFYARYILENRWLEAEEYIADSREYWYDYSDALDWIGIKVPLEPPSGFKQD